MLRDRLRRHDLELYLGLAFVISWAAWPLVALNPQSSPLVPFGPLVAAVVASLVGGGMPALKRLLRQLGRWDCSPRWYAIALVGPGVVTMAAAATSVGLGSQPEDGSADWSVIAGSFASTLVIVGLFEEVGWRGYALPRLQRRLSPFVAAIVLGLIWGLWHLPELLSDPDGQRPAVPFLLFVVAQSVVLAWLYTATNAALPIVIISHTATNTTAMLVLPRFVGPDYQLTWWLLAVMWTAAAALATTIARTQTTTPKPADTGAGTRDPRHRADGSQNTPQGYKVES